MQAASQELQCKLQATSCNAYADLLGAISERMDAEIMHEHQAGTSVSVGRCPQTMLRSVMYCQARTCRLLFAVAVCN